ncbi:uncharacterized protein LOC116603616 [Nematostella vectensis]|uniref:uncharacterized protein LOC116603616 n=1 Tax=Nematostella vectensis TaxID=45351 RepID=UPI00138FFCE4|nr:uncharacterized protein LOC116603616 [Nematostella vectensis]
MFVKALVVLALVVCMVQAKPSYLELRRRVEALEEAVRPKRFTKCGRDVVGECRKKRDCDRNNGFITKDAHCDTFGDVCCGFLISTGEAGQHVEEKSSSCCF